MIVHSHAKLFAGDLTRIAAFAALIAALGLPGKMTPFGETVPITAQTLGIMLAGALIGPYLGALSVVTFLALVAAGLPLLAGGRGGISWMTTAPGAGYIIAWPLGALVIGYLTRMTLPRYRIWLGVIINIVGGILVVYAIGVPYQAWRVGSALLAAFSSITNFLPGDLLKAVVTALVAQQVHRALPGLASGRAHRG